MTATGSEPERTPDEEDDYYTAIEAHFVSQRGSPLFITPAEWHLIQKWDRASIPLSIVKEGIDRAFQNPKARNRIRKLSYCRQSVEAANRRFREASLGSERYLEAVSAPPPAPDDGARLRELSVSLTQAAGHGDESRPAVSELLKRIAAAVESLGSEEGLSSSALESRLAEIDTELFQSAVTLLGPAELEEIRDEAVASLEAYRQRMPGSVYDSALTSAIRKRIRSRLGILPLTLFGR